MNPLIPIIGGAAVLYFASRSKTSNESLPDPIEPSWEPDPPAETTPGGPSKTAKTSMPAAMASALGFSSVSKLQRDWNSIVDLVSETALGSDVWNGLANALVKLPPLQKLSVDGDYGPKTRAVAEFAVLPNVDFGGLVTSANAAGF